MINNGIIEKAARFVHAITVDECRTFLLGKRDTGRDHFYLNNAGVRQGKWKYLKANAFFHGYAVDDKREKVEELYDLEADLGERTNLATKHPEKVAELKALMKSIEAGKDPSTAPIRTR